MASKRTAPDTSNNRSMKQTKLNFGGPPKSTAPPRHHSPEAEKMDQTEVKPNGPPEDASPENTDPLQEEDTVDMESDIAKGMKPKPPRPSSQNQTPADPANPPTENSKGFTVIDKVGDLFAAPPNSVLIHACNCLGSWAAGIAAQFKKNYPTAYKAYVDHCKSLRPNQLIGTALLLPPAPGEKHWVGCVFTSKRFGRAKDSPEMILAATKTAMEDLLKQIGKAKREGKEVAEVRTCHINAGLFNVPWPKSKKAIEELEIDDADVPREIMAVALG
ncbi:hypothetical protein NA57DRAFT_71852 [Rhizodiscina lignyota]|uniref:ADP-ribose 1''-phosphate phosphatase n=1 Tax=Rhizodiscina lignyota TaxID=1504668 RepID=A0A9P4MCW7_9PEZI|nr:hypothetical protein NA57DRAFT_71852 [Rhizodiscina lignyota]